MQDKPLVRRILDRLWRAEVSEVNPHFQTDYRIAWLTVLYASSRDAVGCSPHVLATMNILGLHPSKVWPAIIARRKAQLGNDYPRFYDAEGNWIAEPINDPFAGHGQPSSPRKPVQSVKLPPKTDRAA